MSQDQPPPSEPISPEPFEMPPESTLEDSFGEAENLQAENLTEAAQAISGGTKPVDGTAANGTAVDAKAAETEAKALSSEIAARRSPPSRRSAPADDEILPQTLLRLLSEVAVAAQPLLKQQGIKALRGTIQLLEKTVDRLEAEPTPKQAQRRVPAPDPASENALPSSSQTNAGRLAPTFSTAALGEKFRAIQQQAWRSWRPLLRQIRDRLPASMHRKLSDRALTGAIAGLLVVLLWTASSLLPAKPQPTSIANAPPAETLAPSPVTPLTPAPLTPSPTSTPAPLSTPTPIPPLVQAPDLPKPVEISPVPVKPSTPSPPLKLTPEQTLIARIQDQVAAISNQYANGLVQSIQANFRGSRLIVNISDGWYGLSRSQQDKLAGEILQRTGNLDFLKLELVDGTGTLLARSPIVGDEMIILKRSNALAEAF